MFIGHGGNLVSTQDSIIPITPRGTCNEYDFQDIGLKVIQAVYSVMVKHTTDASQGNSNKISYHHRYD